MSGHKGLDKWFKQQIINLPNSLIQKLVRTRKIRVNNKKIKTSLRYQFIYFPINSGVKVNTLLPSRTIT